MVSEMASTLVRTEMCSDQQPHSRTCTTDTTRCNSKHLQRSSTMQDIFRGVQFCHFAHVFVLPVQFQAKTQWCARVVPLRYATSWKMAAQCRPVATDWTQPESISLKPQSQHAHAQRTCVHISLPTSVLLFNKPVHFVSTFFFHKELHVFQINESH